MNKRTGFIAMILVLILCSCNYYLPPDNATKTIDGSIAMAQNPKNLRALKTVLTASDINRAKEYELLRAQIDSSGQVIQVKMAAMSDSLLKANNSLVLRTSRVEKQLMDMQMILIAMLALIVILLGYVIYRLQEKKVETVQRKSVVNA